MVRSVTFEIRWHDTQPIYSCSFQPIASNHLRRVLDHNLGQGLFLSLSLALDTACSLFSSFQPLDLPPERPSPTCHPPAPAPAPAPARAQQQPHLLLRPPPSPFPFSPLSWLAARAGGWLPLEVTTTLAYVNQTQTPVPFPLSTH